MKSLFQMVRARDGVRSDVFVTTPHELIFLLHKSLSAFNDAVPVFCVFGALLAMEVSADVVASFNPTGDFVLCLVDDVDSVVAGSAPSFSRVPLLNVNTFIRLFSDNTGV